MNLAWYCKDVHNAEFNRQNLSSEPLVSEHDVIDIPYVNGVSHMFTKCLFPLLFQSL